MTMESVYIMFQFPRSLFEKEGSKEKMNNLILKRDKAYVLHLLRCTVALMRKILTGPFA